MPKTAIQEAIESWEIQIKECNGIFQSDMRTLLYAQLKYLKELREKEIKALNNAQNYYY